MYGRGRTAVLEAASRIAAAALALLLAIALLAFLSGEGGNACLPALVFVLFALIAMGPIAAPRSGAILAARPSRAAARSPPSHS